jgi:hypothetical protein
MKFERDQYGMRIVQRDAEGRDVWMMDRDRRKRESYLRTKARKEAEIKALNLKIADIPADVLAAIELDCRRYREVRIAAALRRIGEVKLEAEKN